MHVALLCFMLLNGYTFTHSTVKPIATNPETMVSALEERILLSNNPATLEEIIASLQNIELSSDDQTRLLMCILYETGTYVQQSHITLLEILQCHADYWSNQASSSLTHYYLNQYVHTLFQKQSALATCYVHQEKIYQLQEKQYEIVGGIDLLLQERIFEKQKREQKAWITQLYATLTFPSGFEELSFSEALEHIKTMLQELPKKKKQLYHTIGSANIPHYITMKHLLSYVSIIGTAYGLYQYAQWDKLPPSLQQLFEITVINPCYLIKNTLNSADQGSDIEQKITALLTPTISEERFHACSNETADRTIAHIKDCYIMLGLSEAEIEQQLYHANAKERLLKGDYHLATGVLAELLRKLSKESVLISMVTKNALNEKIGILLSLIIETLDINFTSTHFSLFNIIREQQSTMQHIRKFTQLLVGCGTLTIFPLIFWTLVSQYRTSRCNGKDTHARIHGYLYDLHNIGDHKDPITPKDWGKIIFLSHQLRCSLQSIHPTHTARVQKAIKKLTSSYHTHTYKQNIGLVELLLSSENN